MNTDYYKILGVEKDADQKTIKIAYKQLAKKYHPDISKEENAEERFKEIAEAYDVLGDEEKRKNYDTYGANYQDFGFDQRYQQGQYYRGYSTYDMGSAKILNLKWWHKLLLVLLLIAIGWILLSIFLFLLPFIIIILIIRFIFKLFT